MLSSVKKVNVYWTSMGFECSFPMVELKNLKREMELKRVFFMEKKVQLINMNMRKQDVIYNK
jgi:hypothetical protein